MEKHRLTFDKQERLKSIKQIGRLFDEGKSFVVYPVRVTWALADQQSPAKTLVAFSVSKKNFRHAVDRNLLKRRMKEAYRLNKDLLPPMEGGKQIILMLIYIGREKQAFHPIEMAVKNALKKLKIKANG